MRRSGKTTRTIDEAIQKLFTYGEITVPLNIGNRMYLNNKREETIVIDPDAKIGNEVQRDLFSRIRKRLELEHRCMITVDVRAMMITIPKYTAGVDPYKKEE